MNSIRLRDKDNTLTIEANEEQAKVQQGEDVVVISGWSEASEQGRDIVKASHVFEWSWIDR